MKKSKNQLNEKEKGFNEFESLRKSSRLKPNIKKSSKNWKNSLFDEEDDNNVYDYQKNDDFDEEEE